MNRQLESPPGRIIWGSVLEAETKRTYGSQRGELLVNKTGEPYTEYKFGIAVSKIDPEWPGFKAALDAIAAADFPTGLSKRAGFKNKIADGDSPENAGKEGRAGCWLISVKNTNFPPRFYVWEGGQWVGSSDKDRARLGNFVRVSISVKGNGLSDHNAGVYLNPEQVVFLGYGEEIHGGISVEEAFGAGAPTLPPGASVTPVVGVAPVPVAPVQVAPVPVAPVPVPTGVTLTPKAGAYTWEQLQTIGHTEETARRDGLIV